MIKKIKQSKNKKGDGHLGHLPAYLPGPAPPAGPAHLLPFVFFLPSHRSSSVASADAASATSCLPACLRYSLETPRGPLDSLSLSRISPSVPIPLCSLSLSRSTTSTREHRRAPPRPVSTPRLADASRRTADDRCFAPPWPQALGRPASPTASSSSFSEAGRHRRRFAADRTSPSPLSVSSDSP